MRPTKRKPPSFPGGFPFPGFSDLLSVSIFIFLDSQAFQASHPFQSTGSDHIAPFPVHTLTPAAAFTFALFACLFYSESFVQYTVHMSVPLFCHPALAVPCSSAQPLSRLGLVILPQRFTPRVLLSVRRPLLRPISQRSTQRSWPPA